MADHAVEKAVWSAHWVLVTFFLSGFDFFADIGVSLLICGGIWVIEVGCVMG